MVLPEVVKDSSNDDKPLPPPCKKAGKCRVKALLSEDSDVEIVSGSSTANASKARKIPSSPIKKERGAVYIKLVKAVGKCKRVVTEDEESEDEETVENNNNDKMTRKKRTTPSLGSAQKFNSLAGKQRRGCRS